MGTLNNPVETILQHCRLLSLVVVEGVLILVARVCHIWTLLRSGGGGTKFCGHLGFFDAPTWTEKIHFCPIT